MLFNVSVRSAKTGTYKGQIPYVEGKPLTYLGRSDGEDVALGIVPADWKDNEPITDTVTVVGCVGGSYGGLVESKTFGCQLRLYTEDFNHLALHTTKGVLTGRFVFMKKGKSYGYRYIGD